MLQSPKGQLLILVYLSSGRRLKRN